METTQWASIFGPFGAFLAYLVYQARRDRRNPNSSHWEGKVLMKLAETTQAIAMTQAVQTKILENQDAALARIEMKLK